MRCTLLAHRNVIVVCGLFAVTLAVALSGCPMPTDVGGTTGSAEIRAAEGGMVQSSDNLVTLEIPPGALEEDTTITVRSITEEELPEELEDFPLSPPYYRLEPEGMVLKEPASISILLDGVEPPVGGSEKALSSWVFFTFDSERGLEEIGENFGTEEQTQKMVLDLRENTVTVVGSVSHFSVLVGGRSSGIQSRLDVAPYEIPVGQSFSPRFTLTNNRTAASGVSYALGRINYRGGGQVLPVAADIDPNTTLGPGESYETPLNFRCSETEGGGEYSVSSAATIQLPAGAEVTEGRAGGGLEHASFQGESLFRGPGGTEWRALVSPLGTISVFCADPSLPRACCLSDGSCVDVHPSQCDGSAENFFTCGSAGFRCPGSTPPPPEQSACCWPSGVCTIVFFEIACGAEFHQGQRCDMFECPQPPCETDQDCPQDANLCTEDFCNEDGRCDERSKCAEGVPCDPATGECNRSPVVQPIMAVFEAESQSTDYNVQATDADGDTLTFDWWMPSCGTTVFPFGDIGQTNVYRWFHPHPPCDPTTGHAGESAMVTVSDGTWQVVCTYQGAATGTGPPCGAPTLID